MYDAVDMDKFPEISKNYLLVWFIKSNPEEKKHSSIF